MSMTKLVSPSGWNWDCKLTTEIKVASAGMGSNDFKSLVKCAGEGFAHLARGLKFADGEVPMHEIALGTYESLGLNRNADGFGKEAHRLHHKTFETSAKSYRSHLNKDPAKSYGVIKLAFYNEPMGRTELLTALNGTKEAAERNGGLVADMELEKLAKGEDLARSMAARVSHDVCIGCGNKAKNRDEYCTSATCKYGGCATKMGHVFDDGFMLGVDNPHPHWFDISTVYRPACRTAFGSRADYLNKEAAFSLEIPGAELAELFQVRAPGAVQMEAVLPFLPSKFAPLIKSAVSLAEIDECIAHNQDRLSKSAANVAFVAEWRESLQAVQFSKNAHDHNSQLAALADQRIVLTLTEFADLRGIKSASAIEAARSRLPGSYAAFLDLVDRISDYPHSSYSLHDSQPSLSMSKFAREIAPDCSLDPLAVRARVTRANLRLYEQPGLQKYASVTDNLQTAIELSRDYAIYSLSAVARTFEQPGFAGFCEATVRQNWLT